MKQKTSLQICFGTRHHPVSVPQGPRRAGQRLLGIGSDRQTHAQERRADGQRGRDRPDQGGHGGAPSFDGAWWNVMVQSQCAHMLAARWRNRDSPHSGQMLMGGPWRTASAPPTHSRWSSWTREAICNEPIALEGCKSEPAEDVRAQDKSAPATWYNPKVPT